MEVCRTIAAVAVLMAAAHAPAWAGCEEGGFIRDSTRTGKVQGAAPRTYFVRDGTARPGCPDASAACRTGAYVVPGDLVLLGDAQAGYICAAIAGPSGRTTAGLLPSAAIMAVPDRAPTVSDWIGAWGAVEQHIVITRTRQGALNIKGDATWGALDPERVRRGGVHIGEINAEVQPVGDALSFTMGNDRTLPFEQGDATDCRVQMLRRGPYLVVESNDACGGMNVTFSGLYRRR